MLRKSTCNAYVGTCFFAIKTTYHVLRIFQGIMLLKMQEKALIIFCFLQKSYYREGIGSLRKPETDKLFWGPLTAFAVYLYNFIPAQAEKDYNAHSSRSMVR